MHLQKLCNECVESYVDETQYELEQVRYFNDEELEEKHFTAKFNALNKVGLIFVFCLSKI